ncbi:MAG: hypothetical protein BYD32DRAFT_412095 [Podila humilis]|nr:MAG: hypothetical protein BYD32DRAFT_412095 [Podila humilis]
MDQPTDSHNHEESSSWLLKISRFLFSSGPEATTTQETMDQEGSDVDMEDNPETPQGEVEEDKLNDQQASLENISSRVSDDDTSRRSQSEESQRPSQDYNRDEELTNDDLNEDSSSNVQTETSSRKKATRSKKKKTTKPTSVTGARFPRRMTRSQAAKVNDDAPESSDLGDSDSATVEYPTHARSDRRSRSSSPPRRSIEVLEEIETRIAEKIQESQELVDDLEGQLKEDGSGLYPDPSTYTFSTNFSGDDKGMTEEKEEMEVDEEMEEETFHSSGQFESENSGPSDIVEASFVSESVTQEDDEEESPDTVKYYPDESAVKGIDIILQTPDREEGSQEVEEEIEYISDAGEEFAEEIQEAVEDVDEIIDDVAEDVEEIIEDYVEDVEEIIEDVVKDAKEIIEDVAEKIMETLQPEVVETQDVYEEAPPRVATTATEEDEEMPDVFKDVHLTPELKEVQAQEPFAIASQSPPLEVVSPTPAKSLLEENWLPKERRNPVHNVELLALFFARKRGHILTSTQARYCNEMIDEATTPTNAAIKPVSSRRVSSTHTPASRTKAAPKGRISRKVVAENIDCLASFFTTIVKQGVLLTAKHAEYCKELIDKVTDHTPSSEDKRTNLTFGSWSGADDQPSDHIFSLAKFFAEKAEALTREEAALCKEMIDRSTTGAEDTLSEEVSDAYLDSVENVDFLAKYFAEKRGHLLSPKEASYCKTLISRSVKESPPEKVLVSLDNIECLAAFFARKRGQLMTPTEAEFCVDMIRESIMPSDSNELKQAQDRIFPAPTWHERALDDLLPFDPYDTEPSLNNLEWLSVFCRRRKDQLLTPKQAELCKRFIDDTTKDNDNKKDYALEGFHNESVSMRRSTSSSTQTESTEFGHVAPTKTSDIQKSSKPLAPPMDEYLEISKYQGVAWDDLPRSVRVKRFLQWNGKEPPEVVWKREQETRAKAREENEKLRAKQKADKDALMQDASPLKRNVEESEASQEQEEKEQRSVKKAATTKTKEALEEPATSIETPITPVESVKAPLSSVAKKLLEIAGNKDDDDDVQMSSTEPSESVKTSSTAAILLSKVDPVKPIEPITTKTTTNLFATPATSTPSSSFSSFSASAPSTDKPVFATFTGPKLDAPMPAPVSPAPVSPVKMSKPFLFSPTPPKAPFVPISMSTSISKTDTSFTTTTTTATSTKENPFVFVPHSFSPVPVTNSNAKSSITSSTISDKARTDETQNKEHIDPKDSSLFEFSFDEDISDTESSYPLVDMEDCEDDMEGYISPMSSP